MAVQYRLGAEAAQPRERTVTSPIHPEVGKDPSLRGGTVTSSKASTSKTCSCSQDAKYSGATAETVKSNPEMYPHPMCFVDHHIPNSSCLEEFSGVPHFPYI